MTNQYLESKCQKIQLSKQLSNRRKELSLTQADVAELLHVSEKTYQRWESNGLSNIIDILNVFQILKFSTTEIINFFGLSPLTPDEIETIVLDEENLKKLKENGICTYICNVSEKMTDSTIERLLDILFVERLKRRNRKH